MGNVGDKFFLVVLSPGNFTGHVGQGSGEIADFILAVNLEFVMQVACGILLGSFRYFPERQVDHFRKKDENNKGKKEKDYQDDVGNAQQAFTGGAKGGHGGMDDYITPYLEIRGDRGIDAQHFLVKAVESCR